MRDDVAKVGLRLHDWLERLPGDVGTTLDRTSPDSLCTSESTGVLSVTPFVPLP